jgi:hypothetical protein
MNREIPPRTESPAGVFAGGAAAGRK